MQWVDVQQNTDEWFALRVGRFGGSTVGKIMANFGKAFGDPAHKEAVRIALEKIKGVQSLNNYQNEHMERGHEQEPIARQLYEDKKFCDVTNGGYFIVDDNVGVSPDGLVGYDGIIEIKSVINTVHFDTVKRNAYDPKYKWQLCFNLKCSCREWIDYVEFCADFPEDKKLFIQRLTPDDFKQEYAMINERVPQFLELIKEKINVINQVE